MKIFGHENEMDLTNAANQSQIMVTQVNSESIEEEEQDDINEE